MDRNVNVIIIEPQEFLCNLIHYSMAENGFENFRILQKLVGKERGHFKIVLRSYNSSLSAICEKERTAKNVEIVEMITLNDVIKDFTKERILIKIDVEGLEGDVLLAGQSAFKQRAIFLCEIKENNWELILNLLNKYSYKMLDIGHWGKIKKGEDYLLIPSELLSEEFI